MAGSSSDGRVRVEELPEVDRSPPLDNSVGQ